MPTVPEVRLAFDYMTQYVLENVWCNPKQDNQHIIKPYKISPPRGYLNQGRVMEETLKMPEAGYVYHIYQIGQLHPLVVNLLALQKDWYREQWIRFSDSMVDNKMYVDLYTDTGIQIPRHQSYYMFTNTRGLIIAIRISSKLPIDLETEAIYLRVYTNAYFNSSRNGTDVPITVHGMTIGILSDITTIQNLYLGYTTQAGYTYAYVNGRLVNALDVVTVQLGDIVEFVHDASIKRVVTFTVASLTSFNSSLDNIRKYLLHYSYQQNDTIDYQDDNDIYVLTPIVNGRYQGLYYHHNLESNVRMVTHRDYAIVVDNIAHIRQTLSSITSVPYVDGDLVVKLVIRNSGYYRPLVFEDHRLFELYQMSDADVVDAMIGTTQSIDLWRVEQLERSAYSQIMRSPASGLSNALIQTGLGYNAFSKVLGDTPKKTVEYSGRQQIDVPYGLQLKSTAYEYDAEGILLGVYPNPNDSIYNATDPNCRIVEMLSGVGDYRPDTYFGTDHLIIPPNVNWRLYRCHILPNGDYDEVWDDITDTDLYHVTGNMIVWSGLDINQYLMLRTDAKFLAYDLNLRPIDGNLYFTFSEDQIRNGVLSNHVLPVPLGELDLFMNGYSMIEGLDYIVRFPEVVIVNKTFLKDPPNASFHRVHVRFMGFANADLSRDPIEDRGYIEHGVLSNNNRYDIREDRVLRMIVNGRLKVRDDLVFSEFHPGISVVNAINGEPYMIRDIVVPLKGLVDETTYTFRAKSRVIDRIVSDYLTVKIPQPDRPYPSAIPERYPVFSPFFSDIINDILLNDLENQILDRILTDRQILEICQPYEHWLPYDPITQSNHVDDRYVIVHPYNHTQTIAVSLYIYRFLNAVVRLYGQSRINLSPFITIDPTR